MSKTIMTVALVCGPDSDMETNAIRTALELFGARVITYWIGRPKDLIDILNGNDLYPDTQHIILSFHGDEGKLVMPELGEDVYEADEPSGDFGRDEIARYTRLEGKTILANGCSLGNPQLAEAFLSGGCSAYIGPDDYPFGEAALMFVLRFYYELIHHHKTVEEAYEAAKSIDENTAMYRLYKACD